jgi:cytoskeleton protein RodZ
VNGFGDKLRREREMRGVSIEEISESTKIGSRSLRALEEDDFDKLPGGIFNKGFVRAYARFLGLDQERIVADFETAWKEYKASKGLPDDEQQLPIIEEKVETPKSGLARAIVLLSIIAAIAGGWYAVKYRRTTPATYHRELEPVVPSPSAVNPAPVNTSSPAVPASTAIAGAQAPNATSDQTAKPGQPETQNRPVEPSSNLANGEAPKTERPADEATDQGPKAMAPIRLEVFAREDSWLSVLADGKELGQGILGAQKSRRISAQKEVKLKLGNVGGVEVSFNGKPVNIDGEPKQVKELTFTPEGLQQ